MLTAPKPHARDEWLPLRHLAVHWAQQVGGLDQLDVAKRLLLAAESGEISAEHVQLGSTTNGNFISSDYGGLSGFIKHSSDRGVSRLDTLTYLLEEVANLTVALHRDGVLRFAEMYSYPPPPWWVPSGSKASNDGNERGKRKAAATWQRDSCEAAFAALYPAGIPDSATKTNKQLVGEVRSHLRSLGQLAPGETTILREAGRKPRSGGN